MSIDLPCNVYYNSHPDGWKLEQHGSGEVIESVQAFMRPGRELSWEIWGTVDAISPTGDKLSAQRFQQNIEYHLADGSWSARRILPDATGGTGFTLSGGAVIFTRDGGPDDIPTARKL